MPIHCLWSVILENSLQGENFQKSLLSHVFRKLGFLGGVAPCLLHPLLCMRFVYATVSPKQQQISSRSF